jgi:hypothetical protein
MSDEKPILVGARFLKLDTDAEFWSQIHTNPYLQAAVTALGHVLIREEVPDVEVTSRGSSELVSSPERPVEARRSGAKNVSSQHLQDAFISEARHSMGQPSLEVCQALVGQKVTLVFNAERPSGMTGATGILTDVVQPSIGPAYVMLDNDTNLMFPLNSIQEIKT